MACGAPVIVSDVPSLTETVGKAALQVPPKDVQKLAQSLVEMLSDEEKRDYFSRAGLKHALQFTWERTAKLTLEVYSEVTLKEFPHKGVKAQRKI
jgi:glycosyltransferase involved in cell wall biosynthesis